MVILVIIEHENAYELIDWIFEFSTNSTDCILQNLNAYSLIPVIVYSAFKFGIDFGIIILLADFTAHPLISAVFCFSFNEYNKFPCLNDPKLRTIKLTKSWFSNILILSHS